MTTVFRASGVTFTNQNLPIIPNFAGDGLVGAYRPNNTANGLKDLSGNDNDLVVVGNPTLTATGFIGDNLNGFKTPLIETKNLTYISVVKMPTTTLAGGGFAMGAYHAYDTTGTSIYSVGVANELRAQTRSLVTGSSLNVTPDTTVAGIGNEYVFIALVVDAENEKVTVYVPKTGLVRDLGLLGGSLKTRIIKTTDPVELVSNPTRTMFKNKVHLAEALVYNKALTAAQVQAQYLISQAYMQGIGITI